MKRVSLVLAGLVVLGLSACKSGESTEQAADSAAVVETPAPAVDSAAVVADTTAVVDSAAAAAPAK